MTLRVPGPRTRPPSASSESECGPAFHACSHFLRKTGVHFSGKCAGIVALLCLLHALAHGAARPPLRDVNHSAAYWYEICTGQRIDVSGKEQEALCQIYLSSFYEATDEYGQAGLRLFCPPDALPVEAMRRVFVAYTTELPDSAAFLPVGRVVLQALMQAYPCAQRR